MCVGRFRSCEFSRSCWIVCSSVSGVISIIEGVNFRGEGEIKKGVVLSRKKSKGVDLIRRWGRIKVVLIRGWMNLIERKGRVWVDLIRRRMDLVRGRMNLFWWRGWIWVNWFRSRLEEVGIRGVGEDGSILFVCNNWGEDYFLIIIVVMYLFFFCLINFLILFC